MDMQQYFIIWSAYTERQKWQAAKMNAEHNSNAAGLKRAKEKLADLPDVSVTEALGANAKLVNLLSAQRLTAMQTARDQGLSLEQIGKSLGITRQSAWELMRRKSAKGQ